MSKDNLHDELEGLEGEGLDGYVAQWEYPGIGYHSTNGVLFINESQVTEIEKVVLLAMRRCKEVTDPSGVTHRYPIKTEKLKMVKGDKVVYRVQVAMLLGDEIYVYGGKKYTSYAAFMNPANGQYHDKRLPTGIWVQLIDHCLNMKKVHGLKSAPPPYAWVLTIAVAKNSIKMQAASDSSKSSNVYPLGLDGEFKFIGKDETNANHKVYLEEGLAAWRKEWQAISAQKPEEEMAEEPTEEPVVENWPQDEEPF